MHDYFIYLLGDGQSGMKKYGNPVNPGYQEPEFGKILKVEMDVDRQRNDFLVTSCNAFYDTSSQCYRKLGQDIMIGKRSDLDKMVFKGYPDFELTLITFKELKDITEELIHMFVLSRYIYLDSNQYESNVDEHFDSFVREYCRSVRNARKWREWEPERISHDRLQYWSLVVSTTDKGVIDSYSDMLDRNRIIYDTREYIKYKYGKPQRLYDLITYKKDSHEAKNLVKSLHRKYLPRPDNTQIILRSSSRTVQRKFKWRGFKYFVIFMIVVSIVVGILFVDFLIHRY